MGGNGALQFAAAALRRDVAIMWMEWSERESRARRRGKIRSKMAKVVPKIVQLSDPAKRNLLARGPGGAIAGSKRSPAALDTSRGIQHGQARSCSQCIRLPAPRRAESRGTITPIGSPGDSSGLQ